MDSENQEIFSTNHVTVHNAIKQLSTNHVTVHNAIKQCGCETCYIYPNCNKQDLVHGGCIESCSCFKYKIVLNKCDLHKK